MFPIHEKGKFHVWQFYFQVESLVQVWKYPVHKGKLHVWHYYFFHVEISAHLKIITYINLKLKSICEIVIFFFTCEKEHFTWVRNNKLHMWHFSFTLKFEFPCEKYPITCSPYMKLWFSNAFQKTCFNQVWWKIIKVTCLICSTSSIQSKALWLIEIKAKQPAKPKQSYTQRMQTSSDQQKQSQAKPLAVSGGRSGHAAGRADSSAVGGLLKPQSVRQSVQLLTQTESTG